MLIFFIVILSLKSGLALGAFSVRWQKLLPLVCYNRLGKDIFNDEDVLSEHLYFNFINDKESWVWQLPNL